MSEVSLEKYLEAQIDNVKKDLERGFIMQDKFFQNQIENIKEATILALKTIPTKEEINKRLVDLEKSQAYAKGIAAVGGALAGAAIVVIDHLTS